MKAHTDGKTAHTDDKNALYIDTPINTDDKTKTPTTSTKTIYKPLLLHKDSILVRNEKATHNIRGLFFCGYGLTAKDKRGIKARHNTDDQKRNETFIYLLCFQTPPTATANDHRRQTPSTATPSTDTGNAVFIDGKRSKMTKGKSTGQDDGQAQATTYADEQAQAQATAYAERIAENTATFYAKQKKAGIQDEKRTYRTLNEKVSFNVKMTENDDNGITYGINKAEMKADQVKEELKKVSLIDADQVTTQAKQEQNPFVQVRALHGTANALKKTAKAYILKATI